VSIRTRRQPDECETPDASSWTSRAVTSGLVIHADLAPVEDRARTDRVVARPLPTDVLAAVERALDSIVCQDAPPSIVRSSSNVEVPTGRLRSTQEAVMGIVPEEPTCRRATSTVRSSTTGWVGSMATGEVVRERWCPTRSVAMITHR
jgi:hypothetical protein